MLHLVRTAVLLAVASLLYAPPTIFAQETLTYASVTGRVLDPSGALVPHAAIKALATATNQSYTVETDSQGRFRLPYLPVGEYRITAQASGFSQASMELELTIGSAFDITLQLPLPTADTSIQVTGQPPIVEENRSQISQTVLQQEITSLPYEGRNYLDLVCYYPASRQPTPPAPKPSPRHPRSSARDTP